MGVKITRVFAAISFVVAAIAFVSLIDEKALDSSNFAQIIIIKVVIGLVAFLLGLYLSDVNKNTKAIKRWFLVRHHNIKVFLSDLKYVHRRTRMSYPRLLWRGIKAMVYDWFFEEEGED